MVLMDFKVTTIVVRVLQPLCVYFIKFFFDSFREGWSVLLFRTLTFEKNEQKQSRKHLKTIIHNYIVNENTELDTLYIIDLELENK